MRRRFVISAVLRRPAETSAAAIALALFIAFVAGLGSFTSQTGAHLTKVSATRVPVDWQVQLTPTADMAAVQSAVRSVRGFRGMAEVDYARVSGLRSTTANGVGSTGGAVVVAADANYWQLAPSQLRQLTGTAADAQLQQQTAANLGAVSGSVVTIVGTGVSVRVGGVVDLPNAGTFFQVVGSAPGTAPGPPPDNVLLLSRAEFAAVTQHIPVTRQLHVQLDHASLPSDPAAAADDVKQRAGHLQTVLAGQVLVGNNLEATLSAAREDAVYARLLVLLLGLPGAILAGAIAITVISLRSDRQRRDAALLRLRGLTPRHIVGLHALIAAVDGLLGIAVGAALALLTNRILLGGTPIDSGWLALAAFFGIVLCLCTELLPVVRGAGAEDTVADGMRDRVTRRTPLALRLGLDVVLLAGSALAFWLTARSGYSVVVVPEGVPVTSVNYATLIGPALAWPGMALLTWRITSWLLRRPGRTPSRDDSGRMRDLRHDVVRQRRHLVARGATGLAIGLAVTVSAAIFTTTYDQQARTDVALTVGSDVAITVPPDSTTGLASSIAAVPGVRAVEEVSHRLAYVGPDLQDLYAVNARTIGRAAPLQDAFTPGSSVQEVLSRLAARPDGVLLSQETLHDYQLHTGDLVRLRLLNGSGIYITVPFHVVGVVTEFATAPHDSFIVANRAYLAQSTGRTEVQTLLVRTDQPAQVAAAIRAPSGALVNDITAPRVAVPSASGLAASSLHGLARLTLAYGVLLAVASAGLVLLVGAISRRRSLVALGVLGATSGQRASYVWTEAGWVIGAGTVGGLLTGTLLAAELVKILTGIFDPPPEHPSIPIGFLALTLALVGITALVTTVASGRWAARVDASRLRDL